MFRLGGLPGHGGDGLGPESQGRPQGRCHEKSPEDWGAREQGGLGFAERGVPAEKLGGKARKAGWGKCIEFEIGIHLTQWNQFTNKS